MNRSIIRIIGEVSKTYYNFSPHGSVYAHPKLHTSTYQQNYYYYRLLTKSSCNIITSRKISSSTFASLWMGLSSSLPVAYMQQALVDFHNITQLPWWASIVFSTVFFRTMVTLPLTIYQQKVISRIELTTVQMSAVTKELKCEIALAIRKFDWTDQHAKAIYRRLIKEQWIKLIVRNNCHPAKALLLIWVQIPLWFCQSAALRNLVHMWPDPNSIGAQLVYMELTLGGFGWVQNLVEVDSSYILPIILGLLNLSIIEIQSMLSTHPTTFLHKSITNFFRVLSILLVPVACVVPSAMCVYWVSSSSYGLVQNLLLAAPAIRRACGIPVTSKELQNPYKHLWKTVRERLGKQKHKTATSTSNKDNSK